MKWTVVMNMDGSQSWWICYVLVVMMEVRGDKVVVVNCVKLLLLKTYVVGHVDLCWWYMNLSKISWRVVDQKGYKTDKIHGYTTK